MLNTVGLNMCVTLKKMPAQSEHIFDTFEYFWVEHKSTQKYSKVSEICSACAGIFFRVTNMFKPTVLTLHSIVYLCFLLKRVSMYVQPGKSYGKDDFL